MWYALPKFQYLDTLSRYRPCTDTHPAVSAYVTIGAYCKPRFLRTIVSSYTPGWYMAVITDAEATGGVSVHAQHLFRTCRSQSQLWVLLVGMV
jgi:hypothetical protein